MTITESGWTGYIDRLAAINNTAAKKFVAFLDTHETATAEGRKLALDYAAALVQKYGESAAAVACEMYDAVAEASGVMLPAAEPAAVATYGEVARTVNGIMKQSDNPEYIGSGVSRLVKQAGVDTTVKNAIRDGAEWAWIPHGDTCSFCIMLASNGWQKASKKVMKGDHAEHVHANCDCTFAIRFDRRSSVAGYDPDRYREIYDSGEGDTWKEKLNSMRRDDYAANADKIRAQKREAYARNRKIHYGKQDDFQTDRGTITARRVDKYGYNNIYVDEKVNLTERQLRTINKQVSEAKQVVGVFENCDANVVVVDMDDPIASYNPRTDTLLISSKLTSEEAIKRAQEIFTCPNDTRSTAVHELFHWLDADEYRKTVGEITDVSETSQYSIFQREKARRRLEEAGIDIADYNALRSISEYSVDKALENDLEEVYTEYRTQVALNGGANI